MANTVISLLKSHGIDYTIADGRIMALDSWNPTTGETFYVDVTDYNRLKMYQFLNYDDEYLL